MLGLKGLPHCEFGGLDPVWFWIQNRFSDSESRIQSIPLRRRDKWKRERAFGRILPFSFFLPPLTGCLTARLLDCLSVPPGRGLLSFSLSSHFCKDSIKIPCFSICLIFFRTLPRQIVLSLIRSDHFSISLKIEIRFSESLSIYENFYAVISW